MISNLPNLLTWLRIALIPVFVGLFYLPEGSLAPQTVNVTATVVFAVAALTDWLDGYLARSLGQTSNFGAFLDPVADKLMVTAALVLLVELGRLPAPVALVIIGREIAISALREWMARLGQSRSVAVSFIGKVKTTAQMAAILLLLWQADFMDLPIATIGSWLMYLAAFLTLWSMVYYLRRAAPVLAGRDGSD